MKIKSLAALGLLSIALPIIGCSNNAGQSSSEESQTPSPSSEPIPVEDNKVHIIVLAGQSGARGKGLSSELTTEQATTNEDVYLYQDGHAMAYIDGPMTTEPEGNLETFCKPGYGDSNVEIGPEVGIAETFRSRYHEQDSYKAVIVKYTVCGTDFPNHWYSTSMVNDSVIGPTLNKDSRHIRTYKEKQMGPLTRDLYKLLDNCISDLTNEGLEATIDGLAWVHGEMDAQNYDYIQNYEASLKYFINDFRTAFGENIPAVVTGVLTNAAGYKEQLLTAQKNAASSLNNVTFINSNNLYSNSFEPWHYSAQSNVVLGNEIAAALMEKLDSRTISSLNLDAKYGNAINVPYGYEVALPEYLPFVYEGNYKGMSKVSYKSSYDKNSKGVQNVEFQVKNANGVIYNGLLPVNVVEVPFVDGKVEETSIYNTIEQNIDSKLQLYYAIDNNGIYFAGKVTDNHVWSDSELWKMGDMGQLNRNDDVRFFITGSTAEHRRTVCLSAANMFRFYKDGRAIYDNISTLQSDNLFYKRQLSNKTDYRVLIEGFANDNTKLSNGWSFEFYVTFNDLGVTNANSLKYCVYHSDIQNPNNLPGKGTEDRTGGTGSEIYITKTSVSDVHKEDNIDSYFSLI